MKRSGAVTDDFAVSEGLCPACTQRLEVPFEMSTSVRSAGRCPAGHGMWKIDDRGGLHWFADEGLGTAMPGVVWADGSRTGR